MPLPRYEYKGPVDHTTKPDVRNAAGKSVIVTGGANGIGEACVRSFVAVGAFVTFADLADRGDAIERELNKTETCCAFVQCDIRSWDDQKNVFEIAKSRSPSRSVDIVIANAGISRSSGDSLWKLDGKLSLSPLDETGVFTASLTLPLQDPDAEPTKPDLNIVEVNMNGTFFTWKLATHYFRKQAEASDRDRCFIITGSMVAWIDSPGNWEYTATKYGLRGFMRTARRSSFEQGIRINYVAPCWIKSAIRSAEYEKFLMDQGVEFGEQVDVAGCMMRIACDKAINGRSFMITPRSVAREGFIDSDREDYQIGGPDQYLAKLQASQLVVIDDKWLDDHPTRIYKT